METEKAKKGIVDSSTFTAMNMFNVNVITLASYNYGYSPASQPSNTALLHFIASVFEENNNNNNINNDSVPPTTEKSRKQFFSALL